MPAPPCSARFKNITFEPCGIGARINCRAGAMAHAEANKAIEAQSDLNVRASLSETFVSGPSCKEKAARRPPVPNYPVSCRIAQADTIASLSVVR
jgi:hypothetical protein